MPRGAQSKLETIRRLQHEPSEYAAVEKKLCQKPRHMFLAAGSGSFGRQLPRRLRPSVFDLLWLVIGQYTTASPRSPGSDLPTFNTSVKHVSLAWQLERSWSFFGLALSSPQILAQPLKASSRFLTHRFLNGMAVALFLLHYPRSPSQREVTVTTSWPDCPSHTQIMVPVMTPTARHDNRLVMQTD